MPAPSASALRVPGLIERIGHTPLLPIPALAGVPDTVTVLGKAEWFNPGGSVKDRAAGGIVRAGEQAGAFANGRRLLDATSGNTGIAYAWIGAQRGIGVTLCRPATATVAGGRVRAAGGAEVVLTSPLEGTDGAIRVAREMAAAAPARYWHADQYAHPANWQAHYHGTAEELWRDTGGRITHLVAGIGTSGTLVGCARRLREHHPDITVVAVQPDGPLHALEGLKHLPTAETPPIYDPGVHDRVEVVASEDAIACVKALARHGLPIGWSAGAAVVAAERVARTLADGVVVCVLPDSAERYLSEPLWEEP